MIKTSFQLFFIKRSNVSMVMMFLFIKMCLNMQKCQKKSVFLHPDLTCNNKEKRVRGGSRSSREQFSNVILNPVAVFSSFSKTAAGFKIRFENCSLEVLDPPLRHFCLLLQVRSGCRIYPLLQRCVFKHLFFISFAKMEILIKNYNR